MKNFLIVIQTLALMAAAYFTRPTEADFRQFAKGQSSEPGGVIAAMLTAPGGIADLKDGEFKDCWLWVEVRKDGKTAVVGAFDHWFNLAVVRQHRN